jgi:hypothetical protein
MHGVYRSKRTRMQHGGLDRGVCAEKISGDAAARGSGARAVARIHERHQLVGDVVDPAPGHRVIAEKIEAAGCGKVPRHHDHLAEPAPFHRPLEEFMQMVFREQPVGAPVHVVDVVDHRVSGRAPLVARRQVNLDAAPRIDAHQVSGERARVDLRIDDLAAHARAGRHRDHEQPGHQSAERQNSRLHLRLLVESEEIGNAYEPAVPAAEY